MIKTIEAALVAACQTAAPDARTVESYAGQLEGEIPKMTGAMPAVYVMFNGDTITRDNYGDETHSLRYTTLVAAKDLRGKATARTKVGGVYDLIDDLQTALVDQTLDLAIDSLTATRIDMVFVSATVVVYAIEWQTSYTKTLN